MPSQIVIDNLKVGATKHTNHVKYVDIKFMVLRIGVCAMNLISLYLDKRKLYVKHP